MADLEFGFARRVINPECPVSLAGYFGARMWTEVLDDLTAQALVLRQGGTAALLVVCDLIGAPAAVVARYREALKDIDIPPENMLFTATHTHTGPWLRPERPGANPAYVDMLVERVAEAVRVAAEDVRPARILTGLASDDRFAFNRRKCMADGSVVTNPPRGHPDIREPEGPIDPEISLVALDREDGLRVLLANIVNHADTIGGCGVSAGWPGFVRRTLEAQDDGLRVMPLIGANGNINHFDVSKQIDQSSYAEAERIGTGTAASITAALPSLAPSARHSLCAAATVCTVCPREIDEKELAEAKEHAALEVDSDRPLTSEDLANKSPAALKYFAERLLAVADDRAERRFEILGLALGDALLIGLPGEPFVEIGLAIRKELAGGRPCLVLSHANAECGYIPNAFNFGRGGYETHPMSSPNSTQTADLLLAAAKDVIGRLG